jgi:hypothetical protein
MELSSKFRLNNEYDLEAGPVPVSTDDTFNESTIDPDLLHETTESENQSGNKIRLLTYNIFLRPPPVHTNGCDFKEARLKIFCET